MPFFLIDRVERPISIENEWGRIVLETGLVGLAGWVAFLFWIFSRAPARQDDPSLLGWRLAWVATLAFFVSGFIGIGLFTSIPGTVLLFLLVGWIATHRAGEAAASVPVRSASSALHRMSSVRRELPLH